MFNRKEFFYTFYRGINQFIAGNTLTETWELKKNIIYVQRYKKKTKVYFHVIRPLLYIGIVENEII